MNDIINNLISKYNLKKDTETQAYVGRKETSNGIYFYCLDSNDLSNNEYFLVIQFYSYKQAKITRQKILSYEV